MDFNFARLDLFVTRSEELRQPVPASPDERGVAQLSRQLHHELLRTTGRLNCVIRLQQEPAVTLTWVSAGQTAGVAFWIRGNQADAISLFLSNIDPAEDLAAIQIVMGAAPGLLSEAAIDSILQSSRPLLASLYREHEFVQDVSTGAVALAVAFFGMLGVDLQTKSHSC